MKPERGLIAAALTPRGKRGDLNFGACFELIDHLCRAKVPGIALLTAAGEYPAFSLEERTRLVIDAAADLGWAGTGPYEFELFSPDSRRLAARRCQMAIAMFSVVGICCANSGTSLFR